MSSNDNCTSISVSSSKRSYNFINLTSQVFGRLTVLKEGESKAGGTRWHCVCACGNTTLVQAGNLRSAHTKSCGCLHLEAIKESNPVKHGGYGTPEYKVWVGMWQRCTNPNTADYDKYKARTPPESWRDFAVFLADMGARPSPKHSIERVDNDKPYGPGNCVWATMKEQQRNRSNNLLVIRNGEVMCFTEACEATGLQYESTYDKYRYYKDMAKASNNLFDLYKSDAPCTGINPAL